LAHGRDEVQQVEGETAEQIKAVPARNVIHLDDVPIVDRLPVFGYDRGQETYKDVSDKDKVDTAVEQ